LATDKSLLYQSEVTIKIVGYFKPAILANSNRKCISVNHIPSLNL
jgi:hypothetical protein